MSEHFLLFKNAYVIDRIVFAIFIKLSCDGFMFPSFRKNDLLSYSAHKVAFRMNPINCIDIASDQFSTNNGMVSCFAL